MKSAKVMLSGAILAVLTLSACQNSVAPPENAAFGEGVSRIGDTEIARVDGSIIYMSDVERIAASQGLIEIGAPLLPGQPIFQKVLDELIDQRLLAQDAVRKSLDQDDEARRRLLTARERILGNILVENHLKDKVNEATIRRMYDEQSNLRNRGDEVQARHILVKDEKTADEIVKKLEEGADFAALAKDVSTDEGSRSEGGNLGYFTRDMLDKNFTQIAFKTKKGDLSKPFKTQYGWHVLQVQNRRKAAQPSFEEMRSEILNFMTYDEIQSLLKSLRAQGEVTLLFEGAEETDKPVTEAPKDE